MKRLRIALCILILALLVPLLLHARQVLPMDPRPLVAEKYAGWSGVLRLWVFEGWPCGGGTFAPWLNRCIAGFEKRHPGVYVQPRYVDAGAFALLNDSGALPPDMILFPPGLLDSPEGLLPLETPDGLRPALIQSGSRNGSLYAAPVAMGGYAWAWNAELLDRLPDTWRDSGATLAVPEPEDWRRWDAALLALCSGRYGEGSGEAGGEPDDPAPLGVDLGLVEDATPVPEATPTPDPGDTLPRRLPEGFQYDGDAWRHFINGEAAAMPVTQREVRRLQRLAEQGRGPDWRLSPGDAAFTDQLLSLAIVDREDAAEQRSLCVEFLACLLSDEAQGALHSVGAFSVTGAPSGYDAGDPLAAMEVGLRREGLAAPNSLDAGWPDGAEKIVREFISDSGDAPELWRRFKAMLGQKAND